ncbi:MAG: type II toxin-antitoxin system RelE/ParE family toxin [Oceanicaulis sp.]
MTSDWRATGLDVGDKLKVSASALDDLERIYEHLVDANRLFGHSFSEADARAKSRIDKLLDAVSGLQRSPLRGTRRPQLGERVRFIAFERSVVWFEVDQARREVHVLAIFHGGEDHQARMIRRLKR